MEAISVIPRILTVLLALACMCCLFLFYQNSELTIDNRELQRQYDSLRLINQHPYMQADSVFAADHSIR